MNDNENDEKAKPLWDNLEENLEDLKRDVQATLGSTSQYFFSIWNFYVENETLSKVFYSITRLDEATVQLTVILQFSYSR